MPNKHPEVKFYLGSVVATVTKEHMETEKYGTWENGYAVQVNRRVNINTSDEDVTRRLRKDDIPKAIIVLQRAYEFLVSGEGISREE